MSYHKLCCILCLSLKTTLDSHTDFQPIDEMMKWGFTLWHSFSYALFLLKSFLCFSRLWWNGSQEYHDLDWVGGLVATVFEITNKVENKNESMEKWNLECQMKIGSHKINLNLILHVKYTLKWLSMHGHFGVHMASFCLFPALIPWQSP